MSILFFDTETTGIPSGKRDLDDPKQPRLVQLAMIEATENGDVLDEIDMIVNPRIFDSDPVFIISPFLTKIHGISTEKAYEEGVPQYEALRAFVEKTQKVTKIIAHNARFDMLMMYIAQARYRYTKYEASIFNKAVICTMQASHQVVKLPPTEKMVNAGRLGYKAPRLSEAYKYFTNKTLHNAHNALADTHACMCIYFELKKRHIL